MSSDAPPPPAQAPSQATLLLGRVLRVLRPLVGLLVRSGVTYPALAAALKRLFLEAAQQELQRQRMAPTDSALTLLSGVHRRDVRALLRGPRAVAEVPPSPSLAAEVVARIGWPISRWSDGQGRPRTLPRGPGMPDGFDALVAHTTSQDLRPRAMLDELLRLGVVDDTPQGVQLRHAGFAPRQGYAEMAELMADNLHDHAAAAAANLLGDANFLEQALYVDALTPESVQQLRDTARQAWLQALPAVMAQAQQRFDADQPLPPEQRRQRARFGVYFFSQEEADPP